MSKLTAIYSNSSFSPSLAEANINNTPLKRERNVYQRESFTESSPFCPEKVCKTKKKIIKEGFEIDLRRKK